MASKILITPNAGSTSIDPTIAFQGAGVSTDITLRVPSTGGLSFEGTTGQLFSITDSMSGTIFSANDVSGIPSIEVLDTGLVKIAQYSGNVLLGTGTDAGYKLQVNGTILGAYGPTSSFYANACDAASYNLIMTGGNDVGNKLVIFANGSTRSADGGTNAVTIRNDNGVLNLGNSGYTTNVAGALTSGGMIVASQAGFQSATFSAGRNRMWSFGNADAYGISYFQGYGGYYSGSDSIGIHFGTATAAGCQFTFASSGALIVTGNVTAYGSASDIRLKQNITKLENSLGKVCRLNGYNFNYKGKSDKLMGVIAQEVEIVAPELVYEFAEVETNVITKAVRYEHISALLIEAIKEQQTIIDSQENRIARLEALVLKLIEG